jgi:hypothetical protein
MPGSSPLEIITLEHFIKACRGAALVTLTATAYAAAPNIAGGSAEALAAVMTKGAGATLAFISIGQLAQAIEARLASVITRERAAAVQSGEPKQIDG